MGELRDRMVHDMEVRRFSECTIEAYVRGARGLAKYYMRSPADLSDEEVQGYLLYLQDERKLSVSTCLQTRAALKFLYEVTLKRAQSALVVPPMRREQKLPEILSCDEVQRIIAQARAPRSRLLLMTAYGAGLRVSEAVRLRPSDLDFARGVIRVEQGKGKKDRYTVFADRLVDEVKQYYAATGGPGQWLLPMARDRSRPMDRSVAQKMYYDAKRRAGVAKSGGIHALRHAFATHALEGGLDLATLSRLLGHGNVRTTMRYVHTTTKTVSGQISPLDRWPSVAAPSPGVRSRRSGAGKPA